MPDREFPCVKKLPRKIGAAAVNAIAGHGVSEVLEVDAYLVGAAGFRAALEETESSVARHEFPRCFGRAGSGAVRNGHALPVDRVTRDGRGDHAGRGARFAANNGQVSFLRGALGELFGQRSVRGVVFRHEYATARVFVQTMHHARPLRVRPG